MGRDSEADDILRSFGGKMLICVRLCANPQLRWAKGGVCTGGIGREFDHVSPAGWEPRGHHGPECAHPELRSCSFSAALPCP